MVAVIPEHQDWLTQSLNGRADQVKFVDMVELGHNPARIIPAWQEFLDAHVGSPVRGIGEPIWPGRRPGRIGRVPTARGASQCCGRPRNPVLVDLPLRRRSARPRRGRGGPPKPPRDRRGRLVLRQPALRRAGPRRHDVQLGSGRAGESADHHHVHRRQRRPARGVPPARVVRRRPGRGSGLPAGRGDPAAGPQQPAPRGEPRAGSGSGPPRTPWSRRSPTKPSSTTCCTAGGCRSARITMASGSPTSSATWCRLRSTPSGTIVRAHAWRLAPIGEPSAAGTPSRAPSRPHLPTLTRFRSKRRPSSASASSSAATLSWSSAIALYTAIVGP